MTDEYMEVDMSDDFVDDLRSLSSNYNPSSDMSIMLMTLTLIMVITRDQLKEIR